MVLEPAVPPLMISIRPPFEIVAPDRLPPDHTTSMPPEDTLVPAAEPNTCSTPPLEITVPLSAPPAKMISEPPLLTLPETALLKTYRRPATLRPLTRPASYS